MGDPVRTSAEALFAVYPEWRSLARREVDRHGEEYVAVEVWAPPAADVDEGLWIDTSNDEITVGFDAIHQHFYEWDESGLFVDGTPLEFVQQILDERVAVISWWHDDELLGASELAAGTPVEIEGGAEGVPAMATLSGSGMDTCNRVRVRSWKGTFNVDGDV